MSLTIYGLLTPLGYEQTAVNTPHPRTEAGYPLLHLSSSILRGNNSLGARLGEGAGGLLLLLLLVLNNFCYSCIENLKGKARWGEKKKPSAATLRQAITAGIFECGM